MEIEYWNPSVKAKKEVPLTKEEIEQVKEMSNLFEEIHLSLGSIIDYGNKLQFIKEELKKSKITSSMLRSTNQ